MNGVRVGSLGEIPVFVSPWYGLLVIYGLSAIQSLAHGVLWGLVLTLSLLVHEFGHALVARRLRLNPQVLLHGFGGLCGHDRAARDLHDVAIISAGPAAGLALGALAFALQAYLPMGGHELSPLLGQGLSYLVFVNVFWSLVNLLPLWPLDGGQLFRLAMVRWMQPRRGERVTHGVGVVIAVIGLVVALRSGFGLMAWVICGVLAWMNWRAWEGRISSGPARPRNNRASEMLKEAEQALTEGDWEGAARRGHQLRAESVLPEHVLRAVWRILGISSARLAKDKEAVSYLRRAQLDEEVAEAWYRCLIRLERPEAARELVEGSAWKSLGERGERILERIADEHLRLLSEEQGG